MNITRAGEYHVFRSVDAGGVAEHGSATHVLDDIITQAHYACSGIMAGDVLISVSGTAVTGTSHADVVSLIKVAGDRVVLTIARPATTQPPAPSNTAHDTVIPIEVPDVERAPKPNTAAVLSEAVQQSQAEAVRAMELKKAEKQRQMQEEHVCHAILLFDDSSSRQVRLVQRMQTEQQVAHLMEDVEALEAQLASQHQQHGQQQALITMRREELMEVASEADMAEVDEAVAHIRQHVQEQYQQRKKHVHFSGMCVNVELEP